MSLGTQYSEICHLKISSKVNHLLLLGNELSCWPEISVKRMLLKGEDANLANLLPCPP